MSDSLLLKGLFISIYRTFSLNCRRLQQTKKCATLFLQEKVSKIIDLTREAFQCFFQSRIKPKHITSLPLRV